MEGEVTVLDLVVARLLSTEREQGAKGEVTVLDLVVARLLSTEREQGAKPRSPGLVAFGAGLAPCRGRRDPSPAPPLLPGPSPSLRWARLLPFSAGGSQNRGWARSRGGAGASSGV
jgi:hypothetical protein